MADGDVKYRFLGDGQSVERAFAAMEKKLDTYDQKLKAVARTSKQSKDVEIGQFGHLNSAVTGLITRFGSLAAAGAAMASAMSRVKEETDAAVEAENQFGRVFLKNMALTGQLAQAPGVRKFAESMPGVTAEQAAAAFSGVAGGAPFMDADRQQAIAASVARLSPLVAPAEPGKAVDTSTLNTLAAVAAELGDSFRGKTADDVADLTWAAFAKSGSKFAKMDSSAFERTMGPLGDKYGAEGALARVVTALDAGIDPRGMAKPGALDHLDMAKVAAATVEFTNAQGQDIVTRDLRAAVLAEPTTVLNQMAASRWEKTVRGRAQGEAFADAVEWMNHQPGMKGVPGMLVEGAGETIRHAVGPGAAPTDPGSLHWMKHMMEEQLTVQKRMLDALEKKPIRRDAQVE